MKIKVEDHPGLVRDTKTNAIINVDKNAFNEHINKKLLQTKVINMNEEIHELKQSVSEIKQLLSQIVKRL